MCEMIKPGKYKTYNGTICEVICEANHPITDDCYVVFKVANRGSAILVLPQKQFLSEVCSGHSRVAGLQMSSISVSFPDINYTPDIPPLVDGDTFTKSVKSMITLLVNKGIVEKTILSGLKTDDDIEVLILSKIRECSCADSIEEIFHLIQIWGGSMGRGVYVLEEFFDWGKIAPCYLNLVECCQAIRDVSDESIDMLLAAIKEFDASVKHMGVSFITKHTRYWLYRTLGSDALPIYDRIMARCVMRKESAHLRHLAEYWKVMIVKSKQLNISLMALERQIFKHQYLRE